MGRPNWEKTRSWPLIWSSGRVQGAACMKNRNACFVLVFYVSFWLPLKGEDALAEAFFSPPLQVRVYSMNPAWRRLGLGARPKRTSIRVVVGRSQESGIVRFFSPVTSLGKYWFTFSSGGELVSPVSKRRTPLPWMPSLPRCRNFRVCRWIYALLSTHVNETTRSVAKNYTNFHHFETFWLAQNIPQFAFSWNKEWRQWVTKCSVADHVRHMENRKWCYGKSVFLCMT